MGMGSINHFQLEVIKSLAGVDITMVPFKGASQALTALLGGHIESAFVGVILSHPHYESRKLRGILLDQKVVDLPDIPTLLEVGYKQDLPSAWFAFFAPAGIPEEARNVLVPAIEKAIKNPELTTRLQKMWYVPKYKSPAELKRFLTEKHEQAQEVVKTMQMTK
jgi:tripartite-type tricarboxylate transporter receptor subunit TctC